MTGGIGGGLLKATIGSAVSFVIGPPSVESLFTCFFGVVVPTLPGYSNTLLSCKNLYLLYNYNNKGITIYRKRNIPHDRVIG